MSLSDTQQQIIETCNGVRELLLQKNQAYGDSALSPLRVFSKQNASEQIKVRMDDKLSRLARGNELPDESFDDTLDDLIGYLVLYKIARKRERDIRTGFVGSI